jgi:hypothetical protein
MEAAGTLCTAASSVSCAVGTRVLKPRGQRGQFRPALQQMVAAHTDATVQAATSAALAALPDLAAALKAVTVLRGVGPALGSAVLRLHAPAVAPYMSDEAMAAVPNLGPVRYTAAHYLHFAHALQALAAARGPGWTAAAVEQELWAAAILARPPPPAPRPKAAASSAGKQRAPPARARAGR